MGKVFMAAVVVCIPGAAEAQFRKPEALPRESGVQVIQYIESGETLYNTSWSSRRTEEDGTTVLRVQVRGDNNKAGAERVEWTEESVIELNSRGVRSRYWRKDSTGNEKMHWQLKYDWNAKKVFYTWSDDATQKKEAETHDLGDDVLPGDALFWLLRGFPFDRGKGYRLEGRMVMTDGTTMGGAMILLGEEKHKTAFGALDTYKIEFKPTGLIGIAAPKMYAWYTKAAPHVLVRFEGREEGFMKPRTKNVLIRYEPPGAVGR